MCIRVRCFSYFLFTCLPTIYMFFFFPFQRESFFGVLSIVSLYIHIIINIYIRYTKLKRNTKKIVKVCVCVGVNVCHRNIFYFFKFPFVIETTFYFKFFLSLFINLIRSFYYAESIILKLFYVCVCIYHGFLCVF